MKNKMKKRKRLFRVPVSKLSEFDKAIYVYDELIEQSKEHGRHIPIKAIVKQFTPGEIDVVFIIPEKEILKIISKLVENGTIDYSKKGYVERLNHG